MSQLTQRPRPGQRRTSTAARTGQGRTGRALRTANGGLPTDSTWAIATPEGDPGPALAGVASRETDLIVVGREHAASWPRLHHAAVSDYLTGHKRCPVVVVPTGEASS